MRGMKKLLGVLLLVMVASLGAPQVFADDDGGIEMPGHQTYMKCGGIEMPGVTSCPKASVTAEGGIEMPGFAVTLSIIISTLI